MQHETTSHIPRSRVLIDKPHLLSLPYSPSNPISSSTTTATMSSPSEFLTFFRAAFRPVLRNTTRQSVRTFTAAPARCANEGVKTDKYPDSEHATNKKDKLDVQSENSAKGRE